MNNYIINKSVRNDYIKEKGIMLWCIILDEEDYSEQQNLKLVHEHFGDFSSTPSLYYVGEGTTQDTLLSSEQEVSLESYKKWLKENHIVEWWDILRGCDHEKRLLCRISYQDRDVYPGLLFERYCLQASGEWLLCWCLSRPSDAGQNKNDHRKAGPEGRSADP